MQALTWQFFCYRGSHGCWHANPCEDLVGNKYRLLHVTECSNWLYCINAGQNTKNIKNGIRLIMKFWFQRKNSVITGMFGREILSAGNCARKYLNLVITDSRPYESTFIICILYIRYMLMSARNILNLLARLASVFNQCFCC